MRYQQPQSGPAELANLSPLTRGLTFAYSGSFRRGEAAYGDQASALGSGASVVAAPFGQALRFTGAQATGAASWGTAYNRLAGATSFTVAFVATFASVSSGKILAKWGGASGNSLLIEFSSSGNIGVIVGNSSNNRNTGSTSGAPITANSLVRVIWTWDAARAQGSGNGHTIRINGVARSVSQYADSAPLPLVVASNTTSAWQIGVANDGTPMTGDIYALDVWRNVVLSDAEQIALDQNYWQIYAEDEEPPYLQTGVGTHTAIGALAADPATIAGSASRVGNHSSSGALVAGSATIAGAANRLAVHASSGALAASAATVAGTANRFAAHISTGVLTAGSATIAGAASRSAPGVHTASGALAADAAVIAGSASRLGNHAATGVLVSGAAAIAGSAARTPALVTHTATGALIAGPASISGTAQNGTIVVQQNSGGYLPKKKRYDFLNRPANLAEEIRKQREELGILPKPVQLAVKAAARKAVARTVQSGEVQPIAPVLKDELQARGEAPQANVMTVAERAYAVYLARAQDQARKAQEQAHQAWQQAEQDAEIQRVQQMNDEEDDDLIEILALMI
jgi:hypothetical protein